jgi:hypothetical protein
MKVGEQKAKCQAVSAAFTSTAGRDPVTSLSLSVQHDPFLAVIERSAATKDLSSIPARVVATSDLTSGHGFTFRGELPASL